MTKNAKNNELIFIISQHFYGNRTGTAIEREDADCFLRGWHSRKDAFIDDVQDVVIKTVRVPGAENIVIVYDQTQEDRYVNGGFLKELEMLGESYRESYRKHTGRDIEMAVSCAIPEIGVTLHTRCFACRMDDNGVFQGLEGDDYKQFIHYFPAG